MAAARDQAARALRHGNDGAADDRAGSPPAPSEPLRAHPAGESLRGVEAEPVIEKPQPQAPAAAAAPAPAKPGRRRFVLLGLGALVALALAGYGAHYVLVGRFYVSTDDAYVRANNTVLGARVTGHITSILA